MALEDERVSVVAGPTALSVSLVVANTTISVRLPRPAGTMEFGEEQVRSVALRSARRALEVAAEELRSIT